MSSTRRKKLRQPDGYVGILAADIHFPENGSLKDKRQYLRSLRAGLARKLGASVAEVGYHDLWQLSRIIVSISSTSYPELDRALDMAVRFIEARDLQVSVVHRELIKISGDAYDPAPADFWSGDTELELEVPGNSEDGD